jgi:hypothetical protein
MTSWSARTQAIPSGEKLEIFDGTSQLCCREFFVLLDSSMDFARWYSELLADRQSDAYFWEFPPITTETVDAGVEFVIIDSTLLTGLPPDPTPFQSQFSAQPGLDVISFPNLGGDAVLVVPAPIAPGDAYPHLAAFLRRAPESQKISLWRTAARVVNENLGTSPRWLSTAGLGVNWLHLRLDTRPKYYSFLPYTEAGG